jgi:aconitate hydratase
MGQVPAAGTNSLRTFPRNFPGRSGSPDDAVYLCSPETAAASALAGAIVDPRDWASAQGIPYPDLQVPPQHSVNPDMLEPPPPADRARDQALLKGPNIGSLPDFDGLPDHLEVPVALKVGDNLSTDEISPAGAAALPYRSNIAKLAEFTFRPVDPEYVTRVGELGDHAVVGGANYGQGSSREHAAITPRLLGMRLVMASSYARIHRQNLANFGVLACEFAEDSDYDTIVPGDVVVIDDLHDTLRSAELIDARIGDRTVQLRHQLSPREVDMVLAGGVIPLHRQQHAR